MHTRTRERASVPLSSTQKRTAAGQVTSNRRPPPPPPTKQARLVTLLFQLTVPLRSKLTILAVPSSRLYGGCSVQILTIPLHRLLQRPVIPVLIFGLLLLLHRHRRPHTKAVLATLVDAELVDIPLISAGRADFFSQPGLHLLRLGLVELHVLLGDGNSVGDFELADGLDDHVGSLDDVARVAVELGVDQTLAALGGGGFRAELGRRPRAPAEARDAEFAAGRQIGFDGARIFEDCRVRLFGPAPEHERDDRWDDGERRVNFAQHTADGPGRVGQHEGVHFRHQAWFETAVAHDVGDVHFAARGRGILVG